MFARYILHNIFIVLITQFNLKTWAIYILFP